MMRRVTRMRLEGAIADRAGDRLCALWPKDRTPVSWALIAELWGAVPCKRGTQLSALPPLTIALPSARAPSPSGLAWPTRPIQFGMTVAADCPSRFVTITLDARHTHFLKSFWLLPSFTASTILSGKAGGVTAIATCFALNRFSQPAPPSSQTVTAISSPFHQLLKSRLNWSVGWPDSARQFFPQQP